MPASFVRPKPARRFALRVLAMCAVMAAVSQAQAAKLTGRIENNKTLVLLTGPIERGDAVLFESLVLNARDAGRPVTTVILQSPGGVVSESAAILQLVQKERIATVVPHKATCASACFFIFAAGAEKSAAYGSGIGVHDVHQRRGNVRTRSRYATESAVRLLLGLGVPAAVVGRMVDTPPERVSWLTTAELRQMGVRMIGDPIAAREPAPQARTNQSAPDEGVAIVAPERPVRKR